MLNPQINTNTVGFKLQEVIDSYLQKFAVGSNLKSPGGHCSAFAQKVLGEFDRINHHSIDGEVRRLAGGTTGFGDTSLPMGFQRTVIKEALSDLRILDLVNTSTDPNAQITTSIPYELRDIAAILNNGVVFEAQPIHRASISQAISVAYILPIKLAFLISNELMHFSKSSGIDWDAYARSVDSIARLLKELVSKKISNELQRSSDAYLAVAITTEGFDTQLDGSTVDTVKTVQFPIVRQHQQFDIQGNVIGSVENPIIVRLNGSAISEYDGSSTQSSGTYYRITSYNLGYVQFVSELGAPVTPPNSAGADNIDYSYATNVAKFDTDNGSEKIEVHLNGLLRSIGARKAMLSGDRFITPDFLLMSPIMNDIVTNAEQFTASGQRSGSDTGAAGDLERVKGVSAWSTNTASFCDIGDERIIMGQRGTLSYTIAKAFQPGDPIEVVDSTGRPTGQKQAYGEEYSAIKVPAPIRNRLTSVLAYSVTGR